MRRLLFLFLITLAALPTGRCLAQTPIEHLSSGTWKIMAMGIDNEGDGVSEKTIMRPCNVGSTLIFAPNGVGIAYKGPRPCNTVAPATSNFTWTKKGPDAVEVTANGKAETWKILKLETNEIVMWMTNSKLLYTLHKKSR